MPVSNTISNDIKKNPLSTEYDSLDFLDDVDTPVGSDEFKQRFSTFLKIISNKIESLLLDNIRLRDELTAKDITIAKLKKTSTSIQDGPLITESIIHKNTLNSTKKSTMSSSDLHVPLPHNDDQRQEDSSHDVILKNENQRLLSELAALKKQIHTSSSHIHKTTISNQESPSLKITTQPMAVESFESLSTPLKETTRDDSIHFQAPLSSTIPNHSIYTKQNGVFCSSLNPTSRTQSMQIPQNYYGGQHSGRSTQSTASSTSSSNLPSAGTLRMTSSSHSMTMHPQMSGTPLGHGFYGFGRPTSNVQFQPVCAPTNYFGFR